MDKAGPYWGHSENDNGKGVPELLKDHLERVAAKAGLLAEPLGMGRLAVAAGRLHDLGKYADQMQHRLRGEPEAGRDHWTTGAMAAVARYATHPQAASAIALSILGHHTGLTELHEFTSLQSDLPARLRNEPERFTDVNLAGLIQRFREDGGDFPRISGASKVLPNDTNVAAMLDLRMLFSCLVDADFLETEGHFAGDATVPRRPRPPGPVLDFARSLVALREHVADLHITPRGSPALNVARDRLFEECLHAGACLQPGVFDLEAPTGTGKTLALLAFALNHAATHQLDRIVVVLPFLNILDQTVATYARVLARLGSLDPGVLLEDHSLAGVPELPDLSGHDPIDAARDGAERLRRLLCENWDAPIILTTTVQCLESLHARAPSACRKLHRMARSVLLFDEVQTLPTCLAVPTLATLVHLSTRYRSSIVFATATQPAFSHLAENVRALVSLPWKPAPLVRDPNRLFEVTRGRYHVDWREVVPISWHRLATELADPGMPQVLCIVNLKRHANALLRALDRPDTLHLSTNMCPAHRRTVLDHVATRLNDSQPVRLVATQCVEAGVDLSFPYVYRALGPLPSIVQAAGRCNRHGESESPGKVVVFLPESDERRLYPSGDYEHAARVTQQLLHSLREAHGDLDNLPILEEPARMAAYYRTLYDLLGQALTSAELDQAIRTRDFEAVAKHYRLIPTTQINVLVPYQRDEFRRLRSEIEAQKRRPPGFYRDWIRRARPLTVAVYRYVTEGDLRSHLLPIHFSYHEEREGNPPDWYCLLSEDIYSELHGLTLDAEPRFMY